jgi:hypothetical protein
MYSIFWDKNYFNINLFSGKWTIQNIKNFQQIEQFENF